MLADLGFKAEQGWEGTNSAGTGDRGQCLGTCGERGEPARHEGLRCSVQHPLCEPEAEGGSCAR